MRVLHLIDAASPQASAATLALMAESFGRLGRTRQHALLLGQGRLRRAAIRAGLTDARSMAVPFGRAVLAWPGVARRAGESGPFDLIHCWSLGTFTLPSLAWRGTPRALTLTVPPPPRAMHWLRTLIGEGGGAPVALLPISNTIRRELLSHGVPERVVHVLRPGLDMGKVAHAERATLRESWGVESDRVKVIALLSDPPHAADARTAGMAVGLADEVYRAAKGASAGGGSAGPGLRLLVHTAQSHRGRVDAMNRQLGRPWRCFQDSRLSRPWEVLPGCDAALAMGPHAGGLSLLWAMSANVPIVGEATYAVSEVVEDRHSALLAKPGEPKALAHRLARLFADRQLAWKLRDAARHEAYSFFSRQRYVQSLQAVYEQLAAGKPVEVPAMPITGGLRFTGRA